MLSIDELEWSWSGGKTDRICGWYLVVRGGCGVFVTEECPQDSRVDSYLAVLGRVVAA